MPFWEFECANPAEAVERTFGSGNLAIGVSNAKLKITGLVAVAIMQRKKKQEVVFLDGAKTAHTDSV